MPLKRKRKTETETNEQPGAAAGTEKTEQIPAQPAGASAPPAQGPSAWNLDAFAPYQTGSNPDAPLFEEQAPNDAAFERTDVYPNGLLSGLNPLPAEEIERTDVFDRDQLPEKTDTFESISQFDKTLQGEHPEQFDRTIPYDMSSSNGATPHFASDAPELEPLPSIFASFQEEKSHPAAPLFDDSISMPEAKTPAFEVLPTEPMETIAPSYDAIEPTAPAFDATPDLTHFANKTQRFTNEDLGLAAPPDLGSVTGVSPTYTGARTFGGSPLHEPEADLSRTFASAGRLIVRLGRFSASYEVDRPEIVIGRPDPESEIFPEVAIEWDDAISRRHARILHREDGDYIEDTGSTNGTKLNGTPLGPRDPQLLHSGDLIHVGSRTEIIYYA